jgi:hypothetical protein
MKIQLLAILIIMVFPACGILSTKDSMWPDDLPRYEYFLQEYQRDLVNTNTQNLDQYLTWVTRFYHGWELYPSGWNNIKHDLLLRIKDPQLAKDVNDKMDDLGLSISREWAKNNDTRVINTRHVSIWGNALLKSLEKGETLQIIERIASDVQDLIGKKISADVITENRFYVEEDIFKDVN